MIPLVFVVDGIHERRNAIASTLEQAGYIIETFATTRALETAEQLCPEVAIIATTLSDGDGRELCRRFRHNSGLPGIRLILLSDKEDEAITEIGADACICPPFIPEEIVEAVQTVLRTKAPALQGDIFINSSAMKIMVGGREISTTTLEFRLIDYMAHHQGKVFTRDALLDAVWGDLQFITPRSVDACIRRIRRKIEPNVTTPTFLKTIRGVGYKFEAKPVWGPSSDLCQCKICRSARMRAQVPPPSRPNSFSTRAGSFR